MILADTFAAEILALAEADRDQYFANTLAMLETAPKFIFESATAELATNANTDPAKAARHLPLPDKLAWLEFHTAAGSKVGFFIQAIDESMRTAKVILACAVPGKTELRFHPAMLEMDEGGLHELAGDNDLSGWNPILIGALALLGVPALVERREVDVSRLNKARTKHGKRPIYQHEEVRLHDLDLARPQPTSGELRARYDGRTGQHKHRREHFCRAHLRFRNGKLELVRP